MWTPSFVPRLQATVSRGMQVRQVQNKWLCEAYCEAGELPRPQLTIGRELRIRQAAEHAMLRLRAGKEAFSPDDRHQLFLCA